MKIIKILKTKIRRIKKLIILNQGIKKIGGVEVRKKLRSQRLQEVYNKKESIKKDFLHSWRIKELREPDKEDLAILNRNSISIPISILIEMKKKYWGGNIYNEF
jgi:hypothetical protein